MKMRIGIKTVLASTLLLLGCSFGQAQGREAIDIDLWENGLPNHNGLDSLNYDMEHNYKPSLRVFLPEKEKANGKAVVACPGGGYYRLAIGKEGDDWAPMFNELGYALAVLRYRMPCGNREVPISDALEAIRILKANADAWELDPEQIGIMGSSAGGHLASTVATHAPTDLRPAFQILFYPVITLDPSYTHMGTHNGFLGANASEELERAYSGEKQVTPETPPAIMVLSADDTVVPPANSIEYFKALRKNGVPAAMHIYPTGGHGWGNNADFKHRQAMLSDLQDWLIWLCSPGKN